MSGPAVIRCGQCRAAVIVPADFGGDNLELVPHAPWCPQVQPSRPIERAKVTA